MKQVNVPALAAMLPTLPHCPEEPASKGEAARKVLYLICDTLTNDLAGASEIDEAKAISNNPVLAYLATENERLAYMLARLAIVERRAEHPRMGKGETPEYFNLLLEREQSMVNLLGSLPPKQRAAHEVRAALYHALAAVERFTQPEASEPQTVAKARELIDAAIGSPALGALSTEANAAMQEKYQESLFK